MLTVFGSTALDTIRTPKKTLKDVLGGAAIFAAISASNFVNTGLIAVVGKDFPKEYHQILSKYLDKDGVLIFLIRVSSFLCSFTKDVSLKSK